FAGEDAQAARGEGQVEHLLHRGGAPEVRIAVDPRPACRGKALIIALDRRAFDVPPRLGLDIGPGAALERRLLAVGEDAERAAVAIEAEPELVEVARGPARRLDR